MIRTPEERLERLEQRMQVVGTDHHRDLTVLHGVVRKHEERVAELEERDELGARLWREDEETINDLLARVAELEAEIMEMRALVRFLLADAVKRGAIPDFRGLPDGTPGWKPE